MPVIAPGPFPGSIAGQSPFVLQSLCMQNHVGACVINRHVPFVKALGHSGLCPLFVSPQAQRLDIVSYLQSSLSSCPWPCPVSGHHLVSPLIPPTATCLHPELANVATYFQTHQQPGLAGHSHRSTSGRGLDGPVVPVVPNPLIQVFGGWVRDGEKRVPVNVIPRGPMKAKSKEWEVTCKWGRLC